MENILFTKKSLLSSINLRLQNGTNTAHMTRVQCCVFTEFAASATIRFLLNRRHETDSQLIGI